MNKAKRLHIVLAILNLTTQRGLETKEAKKKAIKLSEQFDSNLPVTLSHNNNTNNFLGGGGGRVAKILGPTQNAWDPNLTRRAVTRTQNEKS